MARTSWDILAGRASHRITVEQSYFSGHKRILVDDVEIPVAKETQYRVFDPGSVHPFEVAGLPCEVVFRIGANQALRPSLVVSGKLYPSGEAPKYPEPRLVPWWARAMEGYPRAFAGVSAVLGILLLGVASRIAVTYLQRPEEPPHVALARAGDVREGDWIELRGLSVDCSRPPFELEGAHFWLAGRDDTGAAVVLERGPEERCSPDVARGELTLARGADAPVLAAQLGAPRVRVLWTGSGPQNETAGILLCSMGALFMGLLTAMAWVRRHRA